MYCMEIKDENYDTIIVLHFLYLVKAYNFIRKFDSTHWAWKKNWQTIYVYSIINKENDEGILEEPTQFTISHEAFEELKKY